MTTTPQPASVVHAPTKPLYRRPSLVRKRDDLDRSSSPIPAKRVKVTFDDNVKVQDLHEWEKAPEVILEEVRRAIHRHAHGEDSGYAKLRSIYTSGKIEEQVISSTITRSYTVALLGNVSALDKACFDLVYAVVNSDWLSRDDDYVRIFVRLLANMVSSQGQFLTDVFRMLVENLTSGGRL